MEKVTNFLKKFAERPKSHKIGFLIISWILFGFIFQQYLYSAKLKEHEVAKTAVDNLLTEKINEQRLIKNFAKVKKAVEELNLNLKQALLELPDKSEIPDLLTSISNLAKESGLQVESFKPRPENLQEFYADIPVALQVRGTYHQIGSFFDEVSHLDRIVNINTINFSNAEIDEIENKAMISADCLATTYRYLEEVSQTETKKEEVPAKDRDTKKEKKEEES